MTDEAHALSNDFRAVRLIALHEQPPVPGHGAGPYLVTQHAIAPDDPEMSPDDFLLTRQGAWIPLATFVRMPPEERQSKACFPEAAEVIALLAKLPSRPVVERPRAPGREGRMADESTHGADLDAAILRALRTVPPERPRGDHPAAHHPVGPP